jgi:hypothetical protein
MEDFELRIMELEVRLRPIAKKPVDITKPGWGLRLAQCPHPLDEAGVRRETDMLLQELVNAYQAGVEDEREAVRKLFSQYRAFAWAATLPFAPTTEENFRQHLVLFSMKDQGRDSRDAILLLQDLGRQAKAAGVLIEPILKEVAELCSNRNRFGMGSTRDMLLTMF